MRRLTSDSLLAALICFRHKCKAFFEVSRTAIFELYRTMDADGGLGFQGKDLLDRLFESRKVSLYDLPDNFHVDAKVLMHNDVS